MEKYQSKISHEIKNKLAFWGYINFGRRVFRKFLGKEQEESFDFICNRLEEGYLNGLYPILKGKTLCITGYNLQPEIENLYSYLVDDQENIEKLFDEITDKDAEIKHEITDIVELSFYLSDSKAVAIKWLNQHEENYKSFDIEDEKSLKISTIRLSEMHNRLKVSDSSIEKAPKLKIKNNTVGNGGRQQIQEDEKKSKIRKLSRLFNKLNAHELAEIPFFVRDNFKELLQQAELIDARKLLRLREDQNISVKDVNQFLKENQGKRLSREDMHRLALLISYLKNQGSKLIFKKNEDLRECSLSSTHRSDRDISMIVIRAVGGEREQLWSRVTLPDHLALK